jgi:exocyst complex protein 7
MLGDMLPLPAPPVLAATYNSLMNPVLGLFSDTLAGLIALIKRSLHKYTFLALSSHQALAGLQTRWDALQTRRQQERNELRDGLNQLRSVCLRSFPEFLADVKLAASPRAGELSTGVADFTIGVRVCLCFDWGDFVECWFADGQVFAEDPGGEGCGGVGAGRAWRWELEDG